MAETISKRQPDEVDTETQTDIISSLPDSLLLHILSFLPIKTCVANTSLVSRRWRHLWEYLQAFDFYDDSQTKTFKTFAVFVNAVLALRRYPDIRKMRLHCTYGGRYNEFTFLISRDEFEDQSINTWIRAAVGPQLEELHLGIYSNGVGPTFYLSPTILTTCTGLRTLSLHGDYYMGPCLPPLDNDKVNMTFLDMLASSFPILETLELTLALTCFYTTFHVPPSLKSFKITMENSRSPFARCLRRWIDLQIDAPALKYLSLTNVKISENHNFSNLQNVDEAYLDVFPRACNTFVNPLLNLLRALYRVKHLVLYSSTTKWLFGASVNDFPEFRRVLSLELILPDFNLSFLFEVLRKCPLLQSLIIQEDEDSSSSVFRYKGKPESVPNCLVFHLTFIHFKGYQGYLMQQHFVEYVLRNGLVLETVLISGLSSNPTEEWEKHNFLNSFYDIPMGSSNCQLKFA